MITQVEKKEEITAKKSSLEENSSNSITDNKFLKLFLPGLSSSSFDTESAKCKIESYPAAIKVSGSSSMPQEKASGKPASEANNNLAEELKADGRVSLWKLLSTLSWLPPSFTRRNKLQKRESREISWLATGFVLHIAGQKTR